MKLVRTSGIAGAITLLAATASAQSFRVVHHFLAGANDGAYPQNESPVIVGSNLFGLTVGGGPANKGVIFRVGTDGTGYTNLHAFGGVPDGDGPRGGPVSDGARLYGMTMAGGVNGAGTIFAIGTDGSGYTILRSLTGGSDGSGPLGSLLLVNSNLYGMTYQGGVAGGGTLFSMGTDGLGFTVLHSFANAAGNGYNPVGHVILVGTNLYGMTVNGGSGTAGVLFRIGTNGAGFTLLHEFSGTVGGDGAYPYGSLYADGATLYGMTGSQGPDAGGKGTLFRMEVDGSGYTNLLTFGTTGPGGNPGGTPVATNGFVYGISQTGPGVMFRAGTNGVGVTSLHTFAGGAEDGRDPVGGLVLDRRTFYGWTPGGGAANIGTVFAYSLGAEPGVDSVGDGILDSWRQQYFGGEGNTTNGASAAGADPDGDGHPNSGEFGAGTVPTNGNSVLRIQSIGASGADRTIQWSSAGGRTNVVQAAVAIAGPFTNVSPGIVLGGAGDAVTNHLEAGGATNGTLRFYRIRVSP